MRDCSLLIRAARRCRPTRRQIASHRSVQIGATPVSNSLPIRGDATSSPIDPSTDPADARFEVFGSPCSLLSVSLSASQKLYTRRGTLVAVSGKVENVRSTLSILNPFKGAALGIPFLYQKISSTSPIAALISSKSPISSFVVIHLDGTVDWMITQRKGLLAWTGHTISVSPTINRGMSIAHWGSSRMTGRGLVAVAGPGKVYQVTLGPGEEYIAYPGNVVAYTITKHPPLPYRLKSSNLRLQIPSLGLSRLVPDTKFFRAVRESATLRTLTKLLFNLRTAIRRTIWGDRLFLQFRGPTTLFLSSRSARVRDVLTSRDVNEIADSPPGALHAAITLATSPKDEGSEPNRSVDVPTGFHVASVGKDGKVKFTQPENLDEFKR